MTMESQPISEWEHSHALQEGDLLVDTQYGDGPFTVETVHDNGDVTLYNHEWDDTDHHPEAEITGALADGNLERNADGKSHELASF